MRVIEIIEYFLANLTCNLKKIFNNKLSITFYFLKYLKFICKHIYESQKSLLIRRVGNLNVGNTL